MTTEIINADPDIITNVRRVMAEALARQAETETPYYPAGNKNVRKKDILATVLWDIITEGKGFFADGTSIAPESYSDWLATVKYVMSHLDGPASSDDSSIGTNIFKVYVGVKIDQL